MKIKAYCYVFCKKIYDKNDVEDICEKYGIVIKEMIDDGKKIYVFCDAPDIKKGLRKVKIKNLDGVVAYVEDKKRLPRTAELVAETEENPAPKPPSTLETRPSWSKRAPRTISERRKLLEKYGRRAFLLPDELKFPVVDPKTGRYDCSAILAAFRRARQYGYRDVSQKALALAKRLGCEWAEDWRKVDGWVKGNPDDIELSSEEIKERLAELRKRRLEEKLELIKDVNKYLRGNLDVFTKYIGTPESLMFMDLETQKDERVAKMYLRNFLGEGYERYEEVKEYLELIKKGG
jgi:RNAse (barnase) inhibitor barstar